MTSIPQRTVKEIQRCFRAWSNFLKTFRNVARDETPFKRIGRICVGKRQKSVASIDFAIDAFAALISMRLCPRSSCVGDVCSALFKAFFDRA